MAVKKLFTLTFGVELGSSVALWQKYSYSYLILKS